MGAAKSKDLEIEDSLSSVFRSLWHLTLASWDAVLSTVKPQTSYILQKKLQKPHVDAFIFFQDSV